MSAENKTALTREDVAEAAKASGVTMSQDQLNSLIASIAMMVQNQNRMLEQNQELADAGPIRQIPAHKAKFRTPWNPDGSKKRPTLKDVTWLNGYRLREVMMSAEEIEKLNSLKPGRYNDNRWTVLRKPRSNEDDKGELLIYFPNKTMSDQLRLKGEGRNLGELLDRIIDEQSRVKLA